MLSDSRYLWSEEFLESDKLRAYAHASQSVLASAISTLSEAELFARRPALEYRGLRFSAVPPGLDGKSPSHKPGAVRAETEFMNNCLRLWLQTVELYAGDISPEALRALIPGGYYRFEYLGSTLLSPSQRNCRRS